MWIVLQKSHDHVCLEEVSGQELCLTWTQPDSLQWTFEVSTSVSWQRTPASGVVLLLPLFTSQAAKILHSVVLFDTLATDFTVLGAWLVLYGGHQRPLMGTAALQGAGVLLRQRIAPPDKVHVKVYTCTCMCDAKWNFISSHFLIGLSKTSIWCSGSVSNFWLWDILLGSGAEYSRVEWSGEKASSEHGSSTEAASS